MEENFRNMIEKGGKMKEFLDEVDKLCWKYGYEIKPTYPVPNEEYPTLTIIGDDEMVKLLYIDGEGIGVK
jgi:hypothetical protein